MVSWASCLQVARAFHVHAFDSYTGVDPIGIELSGALKNIYAIAAGMSDGLGFENNTRASKCDTRPDFPSSAPVLTHLE